MNFYGEWGESRDVCCYLYKCVFDSVYVWMFEHYNNNTYVRKLQYPKLYSIYSYNIQRLISIWEGSVWKYTWALGVGGLLDDWLSK